MENKTKSQLIEELYKSGKISFEEAMTLSNSHEETKIPWQTLMEGAEEGRKNIKEKTLKEFLDQITESYPDEETGEDLKFDSEKCVETMHNYDWKWAEPITGDPWHMSEVTLERFKEQLRDLCKTAIEGCLKKYSSQNGVDEDGDGFWYSVGTGGIEVSAWIERNEGSGEETLICKPQFVLEQSEFILEQDKFKQMI